LMSPPSLTPHQTFPLPLKFTRPYTPNSSSTVTPASHLRIPSTTQSKQAFLYSQLDLKGGTRNEHGLFLEEGVRNLQNHLLNQPFRKDEARTAAGKAAALAAWIQKRPKIRIDEIRFDPANIVALKDQTINAPWSSLSRLKGGNPEAFHYWHITQQIING